MVQTIELIPLIQGSALLRRSYNQTLRLVLLGQLRGERNEQGRWFVDAADVKRLSEALNASSPDKAAASRKGSRLRDRRREAEPTG